MLLLESTTPGPSLVARIENLLGESAASTIRYHSKVDREHAESCAMMIVHASGSQLAVDGIHRSMVLSAFRLFRFMVPV